MSSTKSEFEDISLDMIIGTRNIELMLQFEVAWSYGRSAQRPTFYHNKNKNENNSESTNISTPKTLT